MGWFELFLESAAVHEIFKIVKRWGSIELWQIGTFVINVTMEMRKHHRRARRKLPFLKLCSCMSSEQEDFPDSAKPYAKSEVTSSTSSPPLSSTVSSNFVNKYRGQSLKWCRNFSHFENCILQDWIRTLFT